MEKDVMAGRCVVKQERTWGGDYVKTGATYPLAAKRLKRIK
jgi:hypothetical protein